MTLDGTLKSQLSDLQNPHPSVEAEQGNDTTVFLNIQRIH